MRGKKMLVVKDMELVKEQEETMIKVMLCYHSGLVSFLPHAPITPIPCPNLLRLPPMLSHQELCNDLGYKFHSMLLSYCTVGLE